MCWAENTRLTWWWWASTRPSFQCIAIGIDHDMVCAGVVGTAIRNSTSCAGRCTAACVRAGRHSEFCAGLQYQPRQRRPCKWSIFILPRSQFYKKQGKLAFSTSCTTARPVTTGQLVTSQLVCDVTINRPRTTSATANLGFHSQSSLAM